MGCDDESIAKQCGCRGDPVQNSQKDNKGQCSDTSKPKKSPFDKTSCKEPRRKKGKGPCHESHEQFKDPCEKRPPCGDEIKECKDSNCHSSYEEFGKNIKNDEIPPNKRGNDCRDAYKKFLLGQLDDCAKRDVKEEPPCQQPQPKNDPCPEYSVENHCDDKGALDSEYFQPKSSCCSGQAEKCPKQEDSPKESSQKPCESSIYSKLKNCCKDIAKGFSKQNSNSKCSSVEGTPVCSKISPLNGAPPCPPMTEKGADLSQSCCTSKMTCPQSKVPSWADFFPLDARNKKLAECIDKYSKLDPGQVINKCSQFASVTLDTSERCLEQVRRAQERCFPRNMRAKESQTVTLQKRSSMLLSPRGRQLVRRWTPSATLYLTTAALTMVYVTEWRAVLQYVPLYRDTEVPEGKEVSPSN